MEQEIKGFVCGIGTDIVAIERIRWITGRFGERFLKRVFTHRERCYCAARRDPYPCYAARFAAKEAVLKALGTGLTAGCCWQDVEVVPDRRGAPRVELHGRTASLAMERGIKGVLLTLSHDGSCAVAFAVVLGD